MTLSLLLYLTLSLSASYLFSPYLLLTLLLPVSQSPTLTLIVEPALLLPPGH